MSAKLAVQLTTSTPNYIGYQDFDKRCCDSLFENFSKNKPGAG